MPKLMKYDIPPAREARLRMPPGCRVVGATVLQVVVEKPMMTPSGRPNVERQAGASLVLLVEYPDGDVEEKKVPRRLVLVAVGESLPPEAEGFEPVGVVAMGPMAVALYLERENKIALVSG